MAGLNEIAKESGMGSKDGMDCLNRLWKIIIQRCAAGETVYIKGFGTFKAKLYPGRTVKSPLLKHGEIDFADSWNIKFHQSKTAKATLNDLRKPKKSKKPKKSNKTEKAKARAKKFKAS